MGLPTRIFRRTASTIAALGFAVGMVGATTLPALAAAPPSDPLAAWLQLANQSLGNAPRDAQATAVLLHDVQRILQTSYGTGTPATTAELAQTLSDVVAMTNTFNTASVSTQELSQTIAAVLTADPKDSSAMLSTFITSNQPLLADLSIEKQQLDAFLASPPSGTAPPAGPFATPLSPTTPDPSLWNAVTSDVSQMNSGLSQTITAFNNAAHVASADAATTSGYVANVVNGIRSDLTTVVTADQAATQAFDQTIATGLSSDASGLAQWFVQNSGSIADVAHAVAGACAIGTLVTGATGVGAIVFGSCTLAASGIAFAADAVNPNLTPGQRDLSLLGDGLGVAFGGLGLAHSVVDTAEMVAPSAADTVQALDNAGTWTKDVTVPVYSFIKDNSDLLTFIGHEGHAVTGAVEAYSDITGSLAMLGTAPPSVLGTALSTALGSVAQPTSQIAQYLLTPQVQSVSPSTGPTIGGTTVTLNGAFFNLATAVWFGSPSGTGSAEVTGSGFTVVSDTEIQLETPAHGAGTVQVYVAGPGGLSTGCTALTLSCASAFTYASTLPGTTVSVPSTGPWAEDTGIQLSTGETVTISATGLVYIGAESDSSLDNESPDGQPWSTCAAGNGGPAGYFAAPGLRCWSLVGRIGSAGTPFQLGANVTFTAESSGTLYLGVNDNYYPDNSGAWSVTIQ